VNKERLDILLYKAILLLILEYGSTAEVILEGLGITEEEYNEVMNNE
jgi:hypothetical protein